MAENQSFPAQFMGLGPGGDTMGPLLWIAVIAAILFAPAVFWGRQRRS